MEEMEETARCKDYTRRASRSLQMLLCQLVSDSKELTPLNRIKKSTLFEPKLFGEINRFLGIEKLIIPHVTRIYSVQFDLADGSIYLHYFSFDYITKISSNGEVIDTITHPTDSAIHFNQKTRTILYLFNNSVYQTNMERTKRLFSVAHSTQKNCQVIANSDMSRFYILDGFDEDDDYEGVKVYDSLGKHLHTIGEELESAYSLLLIEDHLYFLCKKDVKIYQLDGQFVRKFSHQIDNPENMTYNTTLKKLYIYGDSIVEVYRSDDTLEQTILDRHRYWVHPTKPLAFWLVLTYIHQTEHANYYLGNI